jgi:cystathionine beta-lyase
MMVWPSYTCQHFAINVKFLLQMALRMERSIANAEKIAEFLAGHTLVRKLNYAGRPQHPGYAVHAAQSTSGGAMISFETGELQQ